jgi:hypothetical protein
MAAMMRPVTVRSRDWYALAAWDASQRAPRVSAARQRSSSVSADTLAG